MTIYQQISTNRLKTWFIFIGFIIFITALFYGIGWYVGDPSFFLILGIGFSLVSTFGSYYFSDKIVLSTVRAKPASKDEYFDLYTVTENMAIASGLPMPRLYVINDPSPNAFATGRNPKHGVVCVTTGLLQTLERSELEGVIAHEMAHIKNYDILLMSVVTVLVGTVALVTDFVLRTMWLRNNRSNKNIVILIVFIISLVIAPFIATIIQLAISRKREYLADATGSLLTRNPDALASALNKISQFPVGVRTATSSTAHLFISKPMKAKDKTSNWWRNLFSTHPPIDERIKRLHEM